MTTAKNTNGRNWLPIGLGIGAVLLVGAVVAVAGGWFEKEDTGLGGPQTAPATREVLLITVDQNGQLEARNKEIVRSSVRGTHEISWIIDEGTTVEPGDVLVRLDTTGREERLIEQQQTVETSRSAEVSARVNYENTESQSKSNVEQATLDLEFAKLELEKYLKGEYPQELKRANADVVIATETEQRAKDKAEGSQKLYDKGYITESEAKADAAAARKAELDLQVAKGRLEVLQTYTYVQTKRRLESDVQQKEAALERVIKRAEADVYQAKIDWETKKSRLDLAERELSRDEEDLANCVIKAPVAGRVVYAPQGNRWRQEEPLAKGKSVRTDQEIIHLPEAGLMNVAIKIDETQRDKVSVGLPVLISGPNLPDAGFQGTLSHIAEYLDPSGWWNADRKVYSATVQLNDDQDVTMLRTGMNVKTRIIVARYPDALVVPLQSVTMVDGEHAVYVMDDGKPTRRSVKIGLDNGRKVHILDGLKEGEYVLLAPPLEPSTKNTEENVPDVEVKPQTQKAEDEKDETPKPPSPEERAAAMLKWLKSSGSLDKLELDDDTRTKVNTVLSQIAEGKSAELDPAAQLKLRQAVQKATAAGQIELPEGMSGQRRGPRGEGQRGQRPRGGGQRGGGGDG